MGKVSNLKNELVCYFTGMARIKIKINRYFLIILFLGGVSFHAFTQKVKQKTEVPEWALPGSATHKQVPPPPDFHRKTKTKNKSIGIFKGQSDVGAALVPGSSSFNAATGQYTINSAGYNIWYTRDEFRYLWKKMSGDVSLAADINFPDTAGYFDRKAVLIIRQNLEDDSKEAMAALHGGGLIHLAWRPEKGQSIKEMRVDKRGALRLGLVKQGDFFTIFLSVAGEPMQQYGDPVQLHLDEPFYAGIGFSSHLPDKSDTAILSNVIMENEAGKVK
ncbi:MAG: biopolymer transporter Tol [Chitinophagaceae bacterium]